MMTENTEALPHDEWNRVQREARQLLARLQRYAYARDRAIDREQRTLTLTDDEAAALLAYIEGPTYD